MTTSQGNTIVLVATRKGAWIFHGDRERRHWRADGPHFLGHIINHLVLDPRDGRTLLAAASTGHLGPTIFRSTDLGATWTEAKRPPAFALATDGSGRAVSQTFWLTPCHTNEPGAWYAGTSPQGLFRSDDGGDIGFPMVGHPRDADTAWVFPMDGRDVWPRTSPAGQPAVYATRDASASWQRCDSGLPTGQAWWTVKRQAMCADTHDSVGLYFGTTGGQLWVSHNEGAEWQCITRDLPEIYALEVAEVDTRE